MTSEEPGNQYGRSQQFSRTIRAVTSMGDRLDPISTPSARDGVG